MTSKKKQTRSEKVGAEYRSSFETLHLLSIENVNHISNAKENRGKEKTRTNLRFREILVRRNNRFSLRFFPDWPLLPPPPPLYSGVHCFLVSPKRRLVISASSNEMNALLPLPPQPDLKKIDL